MKLKAMQDAVAKATYAPAEFEGETLNVVFYEGRLTPAFLKQVNDAEQAGDVESLATIVDQLVSQWDLEGDDGEQLPPSFEVARTLPIKHLGGIVRAIVSQVADEATEEGKASPAGSSPKG